ncbi:MAG: 2TM domain-containing protein [Flavobacterium sp.]
MGRLRRRMYDEDAREYSTDERYNIAYKKVKRIKGFYSHLRIYVIINVIIIISSSNKSIFGDAGAHEIFWRWETFSTAVFWGIGLLAHGLSVFGRDMFFSDDWEEKKIQQYMKKEEAQSKWE